MSAICRTTSISDLLRTFVANHAWFLATWVFIGIVSAYDAYLVVRYRDMILQAEENPVCLLLIRMDHEHLSVFLTAKFVATCLVLLTLLALYRAWRRFARPIVAGVASFQLALLVYLCVG
jgi:hypothetical protein